MKVVLQRVARASVSVDGNVTGSIDKGYVALLGIRQGDDKTKVEKMVEKIQKLRLFPDENGKTNLSIEDVKGGILVISQFTLCADCRKGTRPSFDNAASPVIAEELYQYFVECCIKTKCFSKTGQGVFGAKMQVELVNDGPFTVIVEL